MTRCLCKVRELKSPYMSEFRGYRILAATPNLAGTKPFTDIRAPSFDKPYLIVQFGDFETVPALENARSRVCTEMKRRGYDEITWIDEVLENEADIKAGLRARPTTDKGD